MYFLIKLIFQNLVFMIQNHKEVILIIMLKIILGLDNIKLKDLLKKLLKNMKKLII